MHSGQVNGLINTYSIYIFPFNLLINLIIVTDY